MRDEDFSKRHHEIEGIERIGEKEWVAIREESVGGVRAHMYYLPLEDPYILLVSGRFSGQENKKSGEWYAVRKQIIHDVLANIEIVDNTPAP